MIESSPIACVRVSDNASQVCGISASASPEVIDISSESEFESDASSLSPCPITKRHVSAKDVIDISSDSDSEDEIAQPEVQITPQQPEEAAVTGELLKGYLDSSGSLRVGSQFSSLEMALKIVYEYCESRGYKFVKGQSKKAKDGGPLKKRTLRCSAYREPAYSHSLKVDPADHRNGRSAKTNCQAHVNLNRTLGTDVWTLTTADWAHNCTPTIPIGGKAQRPPTEEDKKIVADVLKGGQYNRRQVKHLLSVTSANSNTLRPGSQISQLEDRQISNLMNGFRSVARDEVSRPFSQVLDTKNLY